MVGIIIRRRTNVTCLQETNWTGEKSREIENIGNRLWFTWKEEHRNWVGIIVEQNLKKNVTDIKRSGDRIIGIELVLGTEILKL